MQKHSNEKIYTFWTQSLIKDALEKSTLKYLEKSALKIRKVHPVWSTVENSVLDIRRSVSKARIFTGTYTTQIC